MDTLIAFWTVVAPVGWAVAFWVALGLRRAHLASEGLRCSLEAADATGEGLCRELADLRETAMGLASNLGVLEEANYRLACQVHGKAAVDRAIRESRDSGTN